MPIPVNDIVAIEKAGEALIRSINNGDISALSEFFAPDAVVLPPARAAIQGTTMIPFFRNMAMQNEGLKLLSTEMVALAAQVVRDTGTLSLRIKRQPDERVFYKYLMLWQKIGTEWKLSSMVWNRAPANRRAQAGTDAAADGSKGEM